jgi:hypothetical protein
MYKLIPAVLLLTSCTYSINMVHTEGNASDIVDETQTPTATTSVDAHI